MNKKSVLSLIVIAGISIFFFSGCEKEYSEVVDPVQNVPPVVRNLQAPSVLNLHPTDTLKVTISIEAYDPDGREDIKSVFFNSFLPDGSPSRSNPIYLYDDGNLLANGDLNANDGIYSRIIILPPNTPKGTYRFDFQAIDKKNETSNIISHNLVVQ
jgi:PBP1b-binding outer membrane lipoprotein LpoB